MQDLTLITRLLLWALKKRPDITSIYTQPEHDHPANIDLFPETGQGYAGQGSAEDLDLKRDYLQWCFDRTGPSRGSSPD